MLPCGGFIGAQLEGPSNVEAVGREGGFVHDHEIATFREEGSGLGGGPIVGHRKSGFETRGARSSSALDGRLVACVSSLTLTVEVTEFAEVRAQVGYVGQDYPFISENLKRSGKQWDLHV